MKATNEFYWVLLLIISVLGLLGVIFLCIGAALYAKESLLHTTSHCISDRHTASGNRRLRLHRCR